MTSNAVVGTWRLVSYEATAPDGTVSMPFGPDAVGYYLFTEGGYSSVSIMRPNRPQYSEGGLTGGTDPERAEAAAGYVSYTGRYEVQGDRVHVYPEVSLYPNWVGTDQVRVYELQGDGLTLIPPPSMIGGRLQKPKLVWERVKA